ncbi:colicin I receptor precursor [mine drainage metagenome]|uniref:Colicin I receptor n=1 Tax=mine drainage metagenome TaxID=410659 RepID=A0A1J5R135_9ZZZZ
MDFKIKQKRLHVLIGYALAAGALTVSAKAAMADDPVQRVEITGSSIKRAQIEGALPVQTVTRADIEKLGVTSAEELLSTLTSNSVAGGFVAAQGIGLSTYGLSAASLRGLGENKTLVLVNGRRLANYATDGTAVDINSIPIAAIDHVDVLLDGASAVYGSDAIGGVINFITRQNFSGVEGTAYAGTTKDGGGESNKASVIAGWGNLAQDRYNLTLSADVGHDSPIYGSQRSYAGNSWTNDGYRDFSATPSGAIRTFDPTTTPNAQGTVPHTLASQGSGIGGPFGNPLSPNNCAANGSAYDANLGSCRYNPAPVAELIPDIKRENLSGSFRFKLTDNNEFFVEGFHSHQKTVTSEQPSPYSVAFLAPDLKFVTANVYPAIIMSPTSPYYPSAFIAANKPSALGQPITVSYRAFDGGGRIHTDDSDLSHLVMGLRGLFKNQDYDVAYNHNSSSVTESTQQGYQSQLALVQLLSNNNAFDPFTQYQTPSLAAQIYGTNYVGPMVSSTLSTDSLDAKISGDLFKMPSGMASYALGTSFKNENMDLVPSAAYQSGDISGYGGQLLPLNASRQSTSLYGELNVPLLKTLETDLAVRNDHYPQVTSTNPKISFRFQPTSRILARASYGTGFREPSLPELYNPQTYGTTANFKDPVTGTSGQFNQTLGGNPNLKPEKSEQSSLGLVLDPVKDVSVSIDYWKINVNNLVTTISPQLTVDQAAAGNGSYSSLVTRDSAGNITNIMATNINAGGLKTAGIDLGFRWLIARTANYGVFSTHLNGTYLTKYDEQLPDGTVQHSIAATNDPNGLPLNATINGGIIFRWRHQLAFDWQFHGYGLTLTQNYQSGYQDNSRADCNACNATDALHVGAFSTWDVQGSYSGIKNLTMRAGLKNMFNRTPPQAITGYQYFQSGYDPSYYDAHGMFGYLSATYKFM